MEPLTIRKSDFTERSRKLRKDGRSFGATLIDGTLHDMPAVITGFAAKNPSGAGKFFRLADEDEEIYGQPPSLFETQIKQLITKRTKSE